MNHLNTILIEGNLTRDPQYRSANGGCSFTIANNRYYLRDGKWNNEASFFFVFAYGKLGESCMKYLTKGRGVRVCGRLRQITADKKNLPQDFVFIIAEHVEFQPNRTSEKLDIVEGSGNLGNSTSGAATGTAGNGIAGNDIAVDGAIVDGAIVNGAAANSTAGIKSAEEEIQQKIFNPNAEVTDVSTSEAASADQGPEAFESTDTNFDSSNSPSISIDADPEDELENE